MKAKLLTLTALLFTVLSFAQTIGDTFTVDGLDYEVTSTNPNEVAITGGTPATTDLVIPQTVSDGTDNFTVTSVGDDAFRQLGLTSVVLPANLAEIGVQAFQSNLITRVTLPESVTTINSLAFAFNRIVSLDIQEGLTTIGSAAFRNNRITTLTLPQSLITIESSVFQENNISTLDLPDGLITIGVLAFFRNNIESLTLPSRITSIGAGAFESSPLTAINSQATTPPAISTRANNDTFGDNRSTIALTIPQGTEAAYEAATWTGFQSVNGIQIGTAFTDNNLNFSVISLTPYEVEITGGTLTTTELVIPETVSNSGISFTVKRVGTAAFQSANIVNLTIPASVNNIGSNAFNENGSMQTVSLLNPNPPLLEISGFSNRRNVQLTVPEASLDSYLNNNLWNSSTNDNDPQSAEDGRRFFSINGIYTSTVGRAYISSNLVYESLNRNEAVARVLLKRKNAGSLPSTLVIPDDFIFRNTTFTITEIDTNALENEGLVNVTLPSGLERIESNAFNGNLLETVTTTNSSPAFIQVSSFGDRSNTALFVPEGTTQEYLAEGWTDFQLIAESVIITAPYLEDFEAFTTSNDPFVAQNGWIANNSGAYNWEAAAPSDTSSSGTGPDPSINTGNYFFTEATSANTADITDLISPSIDLSNLSNPALTFNYHMFGNDMGTLEVLVNGTDMVFSLSGEQQTSATEAYRPAEIDLSAYAGQTISVTFRGIRGNEFESDMAIDNVSFDNISCFTPTALGATNITTDQAALFWTENGTATSYEIELINLTAGETVTGIPTSTGITDTSHIVTELVRANDYAFAVRANCGIDGVSNWAGPFAIKTPLSCGDVFVDSGGLSGRYSNFENSSTTIVPETIGEAVSITFNHVDIDKSVSGCADWLTIYNGPDNTFPVLAQNVCGEESGDGGFPSDPSRVLRVGDTFTSTDPSGALTIEFVSDETLRLTGWVAIINCLDPNTVVVAPKIFLQGASLNPNAGEEALMRDDLRVADLLPTTSPYGDGFTVDPTVFETEGANAIVDWVYVELREALDETIVVAAQSALLQRDGDVTAVDGISPLNFITAPDDYFISVNHRNHLAINTANPITLSVSATVLDLSTDSTVIEGGENALVEISEGKFAMVAGDFDGNGQVQPSDVNDTTAAIGTSSYSNADMDLNGQIQPADVNNLVNPNVGRGIQF